MINTDQTMEKLQQLKLQGMAQAYETMLTVPAQELPTIHELMARLAEGGAAQQDPAAHPVVP